MSEEDVPAGERTYAIIKGYRMTELHAWLIQRGLTLVLILVFAFMLTPAVWADYEKKAALEKNLDKYGCSAILKAARAGNFSLGGEADTDFFLNASENLRFRLENESDGLDVDPP